MKILNSKIFIFIMSYEMSLEKRLCNKNKNIDLKKK